MHRDARVRVSSHPRTVWALAPVQTSAYTHAHAWEPFSPWLEVCPSPYPAFRSPHSLHLATLSDPPPSFPRAKSLVGLY
eukprot:3264040-Pleurochrysis_carterae.AAC.2